MTSQGHVTRASLKQAYKDYIEGSFLSTCISKISAHPTLKLRRVNWGTLNSMMWKLYHDQTNRHRLIKGSFGVEEWWPNIRSVWTWYFWIESSSEGFLWKMIINPLHSLNTSASAEDLVIDNNSGLGNWSCQDNLGCLKCQDNYFMICMFTGVSTI